MEDPWSETAWRSDCPFLSGGIQGVGEKERSLFARGESSLSLGCGSQGGHILKSPRKIKQTSPCQGPRPQTLELCRERAQVFFLF